MKQRKCTFCTGYRMICRPMAEEGKTDDRGIEAETDVVSNATGSAHVKIGHTDLLVEIKAEMVTPKLEQPCK